MFSGRDRGSPAHWEGRPPCWLRFPCISATIRRHEPQNPSTRRIEEIERLLRGAPWRPFDLADQDRAIHLGRHDGSVRVLVERGRIHDDEVVIVLHQAQDSRERLGVEQRTRVVERLASRKEVNVGVNFSDSLPNKSMTFLELVKKEVALIKG